MASSFHLTEIWIYPIKSLGGIRVKSSQVLEKGLQYDRRYMLIDESGVAMTQRQYPAMALFKTSFAGNNFIIQYENETIEIPCQPGLSGLQLKAKVWDDEVSALEIGTDFSDWFSERLTTRCKLMFFPEMNSRPVDSAFQINSEHVSLADAYPLLIIGESSLTELNSRLKHSVPMNRFRPNLVFSGGDPFAEDTWHNFTVGTSTFAAVKPCARCVLTTVDQETGVKGLEPLKTLASYRTFNNKVYFGQNVIAVSAKDISEADVIIVNSYNRQP